MKQLLVIVILTSTLSAACAQSFTAKDFQPLHVMAGTWKMETSRGTLYEEWQVVAGDKLAGRSFRLNNGDTVVLERLELFQQGNDIVYSPVVKDQNKGQAVSFKLVSNTGNRYIFENREHDFPQRIIYQLVSEDALHARIEGNVNGQERGRDFKYSRVR